MFPSTASVRISLALLAAFLAASAGGRPLVISPASGETAEVREAAADLARIWEVATGESATTENAQPPAPATATAAYRLSLASGSGRSPGADLPANCDEDAFRVVIGPDGAVSLHGATPHATVFAIYWFASHELGARWFLPGPLGEVIPRRPWKAQVRDQLVVPAFKSRSLPAAGPDGALWQRRNGLRERWTMGHALADLIPAREFDEHPTWFPFLDGKRYRPASRADYNWQPNFNEPAVAQEVARQAIEYFRRNPQSPAFSICINDTVRFDQSPATVAARGPLRWFRDRPDYSDVVFRFTNAVADQCRPQFPDRLLSAYAYYWCENTPTFPVRPNVLPWLTADRFQWYDPAFAREDQDLIRRWTRSGARVVGCYDYFDGRPYLVPIYAPHLIARSIAFEYDAGVRAYYGETSPNWAYDAPRLWLAAQELWDPHRSVDADLDDFFRGFYGPAAAPARRFFDLCEQAWKTQHGRPRWIRYFQDQDQAELYPSELRARLRSALNEAAQLAASDPAVRPRVAALAAAFAATDAFCSFQESRTHLSSAGLAGHPAPAAPFISEYLHSRAAFITADLQAARWDALATPDFAPFLVDDPAPRAAAALLRTNPGSAPALARAAAQFGISASAPGLRTMLAATGALWTPAAVRDPAWTELRTPPAFNDLTFVWNDGPWLGRGESSLGRSIRIFSTPAGKAVRYRHAAFDHLWQWIPATPGTICRVQAEFRGRVEPTDQEYLMASFRDASGQYVAAAQDRIPPGNWTQGRHLELYLEAPPNAAILGLAIYACHQTERDWAEFSGFRCDLARPSAP